nr:hypothetical protein CFP56_74370 [Quercus suber]
MTRGVTDDIASSAQLPLHTRPQETFCTIDINLATLADLVLNLLSPPIGASLDSNQRLQPGRGAFNVALGEGVPVWTQVLFTPIPEQKSFRVPYIKRKFRADSNHLTNAYLIPVYLVDASPTRSILRYQLPMSALWLPPVDNAAAPVEAQEKAFSQPRSGETGVLVDESVHFSVAHA